MVLVSASALDAAYCIDSTEVTIEQFNKYLLSSVDIETPDACAGIKLNPQVDNTSNPELPVANIGACDAWSYCKWAGKRLCGAIGGGSIGSVPPEDTEWVFACSNGVRNYTYPYAPSAYDSNACNTELTEALPVGTKKSCHGSTEPYDEIYDLSGNVAEYVDSLSGSGFTAIAYGGAWSSEAAAKCSYFTGFNPATTSDQFGFRCCADPLP